jgi:hypothetical protein
MAVQVLKLGLPGAEVTLPTESRINDGGQDTFNYISGTSADGTLKVDLIGSKQNFSVSWGVVSEDNFDIIKGIYLSQITSSSFLNYIYTTENGTEISTQVLMQPPTKGELIQRDQYYSNAITITMQET